ncbi:hypothetical protein AUP07_0712 [methanogenic archaeon mixed culture ISO4-G1]|nr:hypothetical protein AUP07_0712 [methanogenic archaeon mixed culture ISO4-G1]
MTTDNLTYEELSSIYRTELRSNPLSTVRPDLYRSMAVLLYSLKRECIMLAKDPDSPFFEEALEKKTKAEVMVKSITAIRTQKVFLRALRSAEGFDAKLDSMTDEEIKFFHESQSSVRKQLSITYDYQMEDYSGGCAGDDPVCNSEGGCMLIRILEDLPSADSFGIDCPLMREDIVTLPSDLARSLISDGKALEIVPGSRSQS